MRIVDVSRFQAERPDPLNLVDAKNVGVDAVNIALDRGRSQDVLSGWARPYADKARSLGLGLCSYRWLDARQSGAEHAKRALERIRELGGPDGMAHAVDCEDNAGLQTLTDYVHAVQDAIGRPIAVYSGRWWVKPRGWNLASLSPFLWAAPSAGYLPDYPGDTSPHWDVDYGGHTALSLMQYAVHPLPGTGDCSVTAVRDASVWATLTGATPMPTAAYTAWVNAGRPNYGPIRPLKALRDLLRRYGYTVYDIGNQSHLEHNPPEDHTPFSGTGWPGTSTRWWLHALDIMPPKAGSGLPSLQQLGARLLADRKAGHPGAAFVKYMNWEPDRDNGGSCFQDRFMPGYERRTSTDRGHIHLSARTDMVAYAGADTYDPVARIRTGTSTTSSTPGDPDMNTEQDRMLRNIAEWVGAQLVARDTVTGIANGPGDQPVSSYPNVVLNKVTAAARDAAALVARPTGAVVMSASDRDAIITGLVSGLAVDGGFLAAVAKAVADENYRRQQA